MDCSYVSDRSLYFEQDVYGVDGKRAYTCYIFVDNRNPGVLQHAKSNEYRPIHLLTGSPMADNSLQPRVATFGHYITERPSPGRFHFKTCVTPEGRPRGGPENLGMYREITALEMIHRQGPLPSVSQYHGCIIINGEIVGVCKDRIAHTLPSALESQLIPDINWFIQQVRHGIDAIHSFGFAHNAICGENIMVTENGQPRITNFTSALPLGQYLPNFSQVDSHGAHRISRYATPSRDHCALQALQDYLIEHQARR